MSPSREKIVSPCYNAFYNSIYIAREIAIYKAAELVKMQVFEPGILKCIPIYKTW